MKDKHYQFTAALETVHGTMKATVVFLPEAIVKKLPEGRVRTAGTINGTPFDLLGWKYTSKSGPSERRG
jgi:hypothetical protein